MKLRSRSYINHSTENLPSQQLITGVRRTGKHVVETETSHSNRLDKVRTSPRRTRSPSKQFMTGVGRTGKHVVETETFHSNRLDKVRTSPRRTRSPSKQFMTGVGRTGKHVVETETSHSNRLDKVRTSPRRTSSPSKQIMTGVGRTGKRVVETVTSYSNSCSNRLFKVRTSPRGTKNQITPCVTCNETIKKQVVKAKEQKSISYFLRSWRNDNSMPKSIVESSKSSIIEKLSAVKSKKECASSKSIEPKTPKLLANVRTINLRNKSVLQQGNSSGNKKRIECFSGRNISAKSDKNNSSSLVDEKKLKSRNNSVSITMKLRKITSRSKCASDVDLTIKPKKKSLSRKKGNLNTDSVLIKKKCRNTRLKAQLPSEKNTLIPSCEKNDLLLQDKKNLLRDNSVSIKRVKTSHKKSGGPSVSKMKSLLEQRPNETPLKVEQAVSVEELHKNKNFTLDKTAIEPSQNISSLHCSKFVEEKEMSKDVSFDTLISYKKPDSEINKKKYQKRKGSFEKYGVVFPSSEEILDAKDKLEKEKEALDAYEKEFDQLHESSLIFTTSHSDLDTSIKENLLGCDHLTNENLQEYFEQNLSYLQNIQEGKVKSERHERYKNNDPRLHLTMQDLTYSPSTLVFSNNQRDKLFQMLEDNFDPAMENTEYLFKVLLPELCLKIFMDLHKMTMDDAVEYLNWRPLD